MASVLPPLHYHVKLPRYYATRDAYINFISSRSVLLSKRQVSKVCGSKVSKRNAFIQTIQSNKDFIMKKHSSGITSQLEIDESNHPRKPAQSIYWLLLLNLGTFVADHLLKMPSVKILYLYHSWPKWFQFFTAMFCHLNWKHLSSNLFFLYIFGKLVEEEEGAFGLWMTYLITGAGANVVSWLILPRNVVSVGASGAVFGLFAVSVLVKMSWNWRKILEVFILGQFVLEKVMEAAQASAQMAGQAQLGFTNVNHIAHLSGALVGVAMIWMLSALAPRQKAKGPELQSK